MPSPDHAPHSRADRPAGRAAIVVPCYNEAQRFQPERFSAYLDGDPAVDLVLVNDGSTDGTLAVLQRFAAGHSGRVEVVDLQPNRGKAEAVRAGLLRAMERPDTAYVGYWDADLATPLEAIPDFMALLDHHQGVHVVLGSRVRLLGREIERRPLRHYLGRVFATFASNVLKLPVYDTQCGAKLLRIGPRVRDIFQEPFDSRWIFDVEWIARYLAAGGSAAEVHELPLQVWRDIAGSKVKPTDFFRAIGELVRIRRRYGRALRAPASAGG